MTPTARGIRPDPGGPRPSRLVAVVGAVVMVAGCGSRGAPLPPFDPTPPPVEEVAVAQRGYEAIVRFEEPQSEVREGRDAIALDRIEVLVRREVYPLVTAELLTAVLDDELERRVERAREAIEAVRAEAETEGAGEGGEPGQPGDGGEASREQEGEAERSEVRLSEEERARQRIPAETRDRWRAAGVGNDALTSTGRQLQSAVELLWERLGLPETIVDPERPPRLPSTDRILAGARPIAASLEYERALSPDALRASPDEILTIDMDETESFRLGRIAGERRRLGIRYPIGLPTDDELRTRFFFGCRTVSARGKEGRVGRVVSLAPAVVLLPPARARAEVNPAGVRLSWWAPYADARGAVLVGEAPRFNVYRGRDDDPPSPEPLNASPLRETTYVDGTAVWDTDYVYAIRALRSGDAGSTPSATADRPAPATAPTSGLDSSLQDSRDRVADSGAAAGDQLVSPVKESDAVRTNPVSVVDTFAPEPPRDLRIDRAGAQVTLRWTASGSDDVIGYRIYRHRLPAPPVGPTEDEGIATIAEEAGAEEGERSAPSTAEPTSAEPTPGEAGAEGEGEEARDDYVAAGWRSLLETPLSDVRFVDDDVEPDAGYAYLVVAVDRSGNASPPARAETDSPASAEAEA